MYFVGLRFIIFLYKIASNFKFKLQYTIKYRSEYNKFYEAKSFFGIPIHILLNHSSLTLKEARVLARVCVGGCQGGEEMLEQETLCVLFTCYAHKMFSC